MSSNTNSTEFNLAFPFRAPNAAYTPKAFSQRSRPHRPPSLNLKRTREHERQPDHAVHIPLKSNSIKVKTNVFNLALPFRSPDVAYIPKGFSDCYRPRRPQPMNFSWTRRFQKPPTRAILVPMSGPPRSPDESRYLGPFIAKPVTRRSSRRFEIQRPPPIPPRAAARLSRPEVHRVNIAAAPTVTKPKAPKTPFPHHQRVVHDWSREAVLEDIWFCFLAFGALFATWLVMIVWLQVICFIWTSILHVPRVDEEVLRRRYYGR